MNINELLKNYREQIDTLDHEIVYLLSRRFTIVKEIWEIKKQNNIPALQNWRWEELMKNLLEYAREREINPELIRTIWEEIHKEALNLEK